MSMVIYMDASLLCKSDFECWLARYEVAGLYPAFYAGVLALLAPMEFDGLLLIHSVDC
jgi:hypothetical protein